MADRTGSADQQPIFSLGEKPPADEAPNEIFFYKKCGKFGTDKQLFEGCMDPGKTTEIKGIKCVGLGGSTGACDMDITFKFADGNSRSSELVMDDFNSRRHYYSLRQAQEVVNGSTTTTTATSVATSSEQASSTTELIITAAPDTSKRVPTEFSYLHQCGFGPDKPTTKWSDTIPLPRAKAEEIMEFCRQEVYGAPQALPLWLILLIIFLVITAVSISAALFWHYWLRKKLYGRQHGDTSGSTIGSTFYTSAPFSSASAIPSGNSHLASGTSHRPSSAGPSQQPSGGGSHASSASRQPSVGASQQPTSGHRQSFSGLRPSTTSRKLPPTSGSHRSNSSLSRSLTKRT